MKATLVLAVLIYVVSSLAAIGAVKWLNYEFCFYLPWFLAVVVRSSFLLSIPLHVWLQLRLQVRVVHSAKQVLLYSAIGLGLSGIEGCNMMCMNLLPGSWYTLIKGTDLFFNLILSRVLLHKKVMWEQGLAVCLIFGGASLSIFFQPSVSAAHAVAADAASHSLNITRMQAAWIGLLGSFLNGMMTVVTDGYLKHTLKDEQTKHLISHRGQTDSTLQKLLTTNAYSMDTTGFSFLYLMLPFTLSNEIYEVPSAATSACDGTGLGLGMQVTFLAILGLVCVVRFTERIAKYYICLEESAVFFSIVRAFRRMIGVFTYIALFGEDMNIGILYGALFSIVGFALYLRGTVKKSGGKDKSRLPPIASSKSLGSDPLLADYVKVDENNTQNQERPGTPGVGA